MKTRIMFGTMAAMATLTIGLLGASVANAGNACDTGCKISKRAGMKSCRAEHPCASDFSACRTACRQEFPPSLERQRCVVECTQERDECRDARTTCGYDCGISFSECKKDCVDKGFTPSN